MYKYEATFILHPSAEQFERGAAFLKSEFETRGIKVLKEEHKGEQDLTYAIRKNRKGRYLFFEIEADPDTLPTLDKTLRIKSEFLKHLFIRIR